MSTITWSITSLVQFHLNNAGKACTKNITRKPQPLIRRASGLPDHFSRLPAELKIIIFAYVYADHEFDLEISEFKPLIARILAWFDTAAPDFPLLRYISNPRSRGSLTPMHVCHDWRHLIQNDGLIERNAEFHITSPFRISQKRIPESLDVDLQQHLRRIRYLRLDEDFASYMTPYATLRSLYHLLNNDTLPRLQHVAFTNAKLYGSIFADVSGTDLTDDEICIWLAAFFGKEVLDTIPSDGHREMEIPCTLQHVGVGLVADNDCPLFAGFFPASHDSYFAKGARTTGMQDFFTLAAHKSITITLEFCGISAAPLYLFPEEDIAYRQIEEIGKR
ncbi:uncharacterized protein AB675_2367 [Cyphellophora attinorum]|uniref:F-box domain-containing protein n=1 Tax=Cyphellophora attinorum TaxID=1664694 RepID=A0A0N0NRI3_9EURO|nr:uncharacterized protein AB675_2367 [Phialophora attinorum]KPI45121.1 hypothetical protein AB675_2367 [Phialophora attinorum]